VKRAPCGLTRIVESALNVYEPLLRQSGIFVEPRLAEPLPEVSVNASQIERIVLNLLSNARAAMKKGGTLRVTAQKAKGPNGAPWAEIVVEDSGPGIPPEVMERIFKPFVTTKAPGEGTGLGLYLSRQIAMEHGGRLLVENRAEGGARFTLAFPGIVASASVTRAA
jgi:signal transduction histidine kinase